MENKPIYKANRAYSPDELVVFGMKRKAYPVGARIEFTDGTTLIRWRRRRFGWIMA